MLNFNDTTTYPYCSKTFRQAGPFDKYLRLSHGNHASNSYNNHLSYQRSFDALDKGRLEENSPTSKLPDLDDFPCLDNFPCDLLPHFKETEENLSQESDADSECKGINDELEECEPTQREPYENFGRLYGCVLGEVERICELVKNPWYSFQNASEFKLA